MTSKGPGGAGVRNGRHVVVVARGPEKDERPRTVTVDFGRPTTSSQRSTEEVEDEKTTGGRPV